ncbi:MAG: AMIN domain-containing protein, partial [Cyanobacteria bacterium J06649_4]
MKKLILALGFLRLWKGWQGKFGFAISSGIASLLLAPLLVMLPMEVIAQSDAQSGSGPDSSTPIPVQVPDSSPNSSPNNSPGEPEPSLLDQLREAQRDAQPAEITGVRLEVLEDGLKVVLETEQPERVEVFQFQEGMTLIVDVTNAILALPEGESYQQLNPVPGVTSLTLEQRGNEVQITAVSDNEAPPVAYFERILEG